MKVLLRRMPAERGDFSVAEGRLEPTLLRWLQEDTHWSEVEGSDTFLFLILLVALLLMLDPPLFIVINYYYLLYSLP